LHSYIFRENHEENIAIQIKQIISRDIFVGHIHALKIETVCLLNSHDTVKLLTALAIAHKNRNHNIKIHRFENFEN